MKYKKLFSVHRKFDKESSNQISGLNGIKKGLVINDFSLLGSEAMNLVGLQPLRYISGLQNHSGKEIWTTYKSILTDA